MIKLCTIPRCPNLFDEHPAALFGSLSSCQHSAHSVVKFPSIAAATSHQRCLVLRTNSCLPALREETTLQRFQDQGLQLRRWNLFGHKLISCL